MRELNRLGVMVDISHVADKTFFDVLELTTVPVIASHSSCRSIARHPRNMTDDMIRALAKNGGVMMINYEVSFLSEENRLASEKSGGVVAALDKMSKTCKGDEACSTLETARITREAMDKGTLPAVSWEKIVEHIDHAAKIAGVDHVGPGLGLRRRHDADRHGGRLAVAEAHDRADGEGLLRRRRREDPRRQYPAGDGTSGAGRRGCSAIEVGSSCRERFRGGHVSIAKHGRGVTKSAVGALGRSALWRRSRSGYSSRPKRWRRNQYQRALGQSSAAQLCTTLVPGLA